MNAACALSLYIYLYLCSSFFRILRMIMILTTELEFVVVGFIDVGELALVAQS